MQSNPLSFDSEKRSINPGLLRICEILLRSEVEEILKASAESVRQDENSTPAISTKSNELTRPGKDTTRRAGKQKGGKYGTPQ